MKKLENTLPNTVEQWDGYWKTYAEKRLVDFTQRDKPYGVMKYLRYGDKILDVAGGIGACSYVLKMTNPSWNISICDVSRTALDFMRERNMPFSEIFYADIFSINRPENSYDVVINMETLEHLDNPKEAIKHLVKAARDRLIITTPYEERTTDPTHKWAFTLDDVYKMLEPYGHVVLEIIGGKSNILACCYLKK